ncbi:MAG: hypothetical protein C4346_19155 [Chloroflexota bacterium]
MRRSIRVNLSTAVVALLLSIMPLYLLTTPVREAEATGPPPCIIRTDYPHKPTDYEGRPVVRVHAVTDCRGITGVTRVEIITILYFNGTYENRQDLTGTNFVRTGVNGRCASGIWLANSTHFVTYQGVRYYSSTTSGERYVTCP